MFDKNKINDLIKDMSLLGLSEKEARVYLSLLRLGEAGSSKVIKETNLHGQYVYQAFDKLEQRGLVQHVIKRGRRKFTAKSPSMLIRLAEEQKIYAENLVSQLHEVIVLPPEQAFEVYQGKEAYIVHEFDMLERVTNNCELLIIGGPGDKFNDCMKGRLQEYILLQTKKNVSMRYIGSENHRQLTEQMHGGRKNFSIRYLPGLFTGQVNTNIWSDALGFNVYGDPVTRFTIFSSVIAESYKQFFETLWKLARL